MILRHLAVVRLSISVEAAHERLHILAKTDLREIKPQQQLDLRLALVREAR